MACSKKISRRELLKAGAASAAALTLNTPGSHAAVTYKERTMTIIDSHHHFWKMREDRLSAEIKEAPPLERPYLPGYFKNELATVGTDYTVLVQAFPQTSEGNRWLFDIAEKADYVAGVVAWGDMMNPAELERQLEGLVKEPKFAGIRHRVESEPDDEWIARDAVIESLRILAERHISYDMLVFPRQLPSVIKVLNAVPDLDMVIDHIGKPDIAHGGSPIWNELMVEIALRPNVYCKLSGMVSEADVKNWKIDDLQPYADLIIEWFGFNRLMYGSDWPVCLGAATYQRVWKSFNRMLSGIGPENYARVFGGNTESFYKLKIPRAN